MIFFVKVKGIINAYNLIYDYFQFIFVFIIIDLLIFSFIFSYSNYYFTLYFYFNFQFQIFLPPLPLNSNQIFLTYLKHFFLKILIIIYCYNSLHTHLLIHHYYLYLIFFKDYQIIFLLIFIFNLNFLYFIF